MYCIQCGAQVDISKSYCARCGTSLNGATGMAAASSRLPAPYAGFWRRAAALMLDCAAIIAIIWASVVPLFLAAKTRQLGSIEIKGLILFLYGLAPWLYFAWSESSALQGTLGKAAVGIQVTDLQGERVSFGRASGRYLGKILSVISMAVGFAMAGFTEKRQALHDKMAHTLVVRKKFPLGRARPGLMNQTDL